MLSNIFDISDIQVKEVMIPRTDMAAIAQDITKEAFIEFIRENDYSRIPVYADDMDNIVGLLHMKDMIKLIDREWNMEDLMGMIHKAIFVPETKKIDDMLKEFQRTHTQMAVVVDEYGGVAGVITMENVLEEIVGDIHDEFDDVSDYDILQVNKNEHIVDARANIDDICEYFNLVRTDCMSGYDTVGGLIYDIAGDIPSVGDEFIWRGFKIQITSMQDNKLQKINFIRLTEEEEGGSGE
jgi:CBS domain containing-hemolysin-like protein